MNFWRQYLLYENFFDKLCLIVVNRKELAALRDEKGASVISTLL